MNSLSLIFNSFDAFFALPQETNFCVMLLNLFIIFKNLSLLRQLSVKMTFGLKITRKGSHINLTSEVMQKQYKNIKK